MGDIAPEILEEVEDCIRRIKEFQEANGRRIHKRITRSRKGREGIEDLQSLGLAVPDDFRALYFNYNGSKLSNMLSMWGNECLSRVRLVSDRSCRQVEQGGQDPRNQSGS